MLEQRGNRENILDSHRYLLKISEVNDREIFRICLDYWGPFVADLEEEIRKLPISDVNPMLTLSLKSSLVNGGPALNPSILSAYPLRKHMYADILTGLRLVMISKMVRPQEVWSFDSNAETYQGSCRGNRGRRIDSRGYERE